MTERLVDQLAELCLNSPSPLEAGTQYILQINDSAMNSRDSYRVGLNPRDMQNVGLAAGSLVMVDAFLVEAWPTAAVSSKNIRISPSIAKIITKTAGQQALVSPWTSPLKSPKRLVISCEGVNEEEEDLIRVAFGRLPGYQVATEYTFYVGTRLEMVSVKLQSTDPAEAYLGPCAKDTGIVFERRAQEALTKSDPIIGGLEKEMQRIIDAINLSLEYSEVLTKYQVKAPRGILLYGPPGTGKTLLARAAGAKMQTRMISIDGADLLGRYYGESEVKLSKIFAEAELAGPAILFIDELDALCPRRDSASTGSRILATLLTLMDGLTTTANNVFVLAATSSPNLIDSALRRPGRFDCEIEIGVPNCAQRESILRALLARYPAITGQCIQRVAEAAHGFVGADLHLTVKEATLMALRRSETPNIADIDLEDALERVKPSAIRDILLEVPRVHWDQIGGQEATKQKLKESIEWPLKHPDKFLSFGIKPPKGVLLYGPPGCSKTLLAKVLATESGLNFMAVKGPELFSKWVGDSEKAIREIFRKARLAAPSIVFFDEFDAIGATRSLESSVSDRVVSQLLSEMDGTDPLVSVTIVAATNRPDIIDPALLRPGRFDRHVYVALPDLAARYEIFMINSRKMPFDSTVDLKILAEATEGYSGAEVVAVCQEAALQALSEDVNIPTISANHFERALALVTPRTPPEMIRFFDDFATRHR